MNNEYFQNVGDKYFLFLFHFALHLYGGGLRVAEEKQMQSVTPKSLLAYKIRGNIQQLIVMIDRQ